MSEAREPEEIARACARQVRGCATDEQYKAVFAAIAAAIAAERALVAELVEALKKADQFITNGIALGFIRMPDASTPDPAHETPGIVRAAIAKATTAGQLSGNSGQLTTQDQTS